MELLVILGALVFFGLAMLAISAILSIPLGIISAWMERDERPSSAWPADALIEAIKEEIALEGAALDERTQAWHQAIEDNPHDAPSLAEWREIHPHPWDTLNAPDKGANKTGMGRRA